MLSLAILCSVGTMPVANFDNTITASATYDSSSEDFTFDADTGTISKYTGSSTYIQIPSTIDGVAVQTIGKEAFKGNTSLKGVVIAYGITSIGQEAFKDCTSLESIQFPNTLTTMSESSFYGCTALTSIKLPDSLISTGNNVFGSCKNLKTVTFGENSKLKNVDYGAFMDCTELTSVEIPDGVISISINAFKNCPSLESIKIPESVSFIGSSAFGGTKYLENFKDIDGFVIINDILYKYKEQSNVTDVTIPDNINLICGNAFSDCPNIKNVTISDGVTNIYDRAFEDCTSLESVKVPDSVNNIGGFAFSNCIALKDVTIPNGVIYISRSTFNNCKSLESIDIPDSVTFITCYAFEGCTSLKMVRIPSSVETLQYNWFKDCSSLSTIVIDRLKSECTEFALPDNDSTKVYYAVSLINNLDNVTSSNVPKSDRISSYEDYITTLTADDGYTLPKDITIKVGDTILKDGYTFVDGVLTISRDNITDSITIEANAIPNEYTVTSDLTNIASNGTDTIKHGSEYKATLTADDGYTLPKDITIKVGNTILKDGYTFVDGVLTISKDSVTDNITIEATAKLNEYTVTSDLTNIASNGTDTIKHGSEYKATLTADDGYTLPKDITIKVGNTILKDGYTFIDGVLTISADKVTGDISIIAVAEKIPMEYTSTDLLRLKKHILGVSKIDDTSSLDFNNDNALNIVDLISIKNSIIDK